MAKPARSRSTADQLAHAWLAVADLPDCTDADIAETTGVHPRDLLYLRMVKRDIQAAGEYSPESWDYALNTHRRILLGRTV
ncbi:hypothetical protein P3T43_003350 [Paraburkholderia sp. GAS41]